MKNTTFTFSFIVAVTVLAFASCTKKKDDSVRTRLTGKWKTTQTAIDVNGNGSMDGNEVQTSTTATYVTFAADGTGKSEYSSGFDNETFSWTLKNSDADLVLKPTGNSAGSEGTLHIDALSSTDLNLSQIDSASSKKIWVMMKKQ